MHRQMRWNISSSMIDHAQQYALPVMPMMLGAFMGAAENSALQTLHLVTSWYVMSSSLGSKSRVGSLVS